MAKTTGKAGKRTMAAGRGRPRARTSGATRKASGSGSGKPGPARERLKAKPRKPKSTVASETARLKRQLKTARLHQAAIAIENARLFNETREALERQTATSEILRIISQSPSDVTPVFDAIAERARVLCGALVGATTRFDGELMHLVGYHGVSPEAEAAMRASFPRKPDLSSINGRCVLAKAPVQIADVQIDAHYQLTAPARAADYRATVAVPMLQGGEVIGAIAVTRQQPGEFPTQLIELLQTFADQAVIAIENTRLFDEVQGKTRDLEASLQQQTATAEVLKVISRSAFDLDAVMNTLTQSASELCKSQVSALYLPRGEMLVARGLAVADPAKADFLRRTPVRADGSTNLGRTFHAGVIRNIGEIRDEADIGLLKVFGEALGFRSILFVPLMREGRSIGVFALAREQVGLYSQREVELVQTFADQAVIAIENARLFDETQEALERQAATSDILRVISQSPTDVRPVFDVIVQAAVRLTGCDRAFFLRCDGATYRATAMATTEGLQNASRPSQPIDPDANFPSRAILGKKTVHLPDWSLIDLPPYERGIHDTFGIVSSLYLPLLCDGECIGLLVLAGTRTNLFGDREVALAESFRDQALIAIENTRLFNEVEARTRDLTEALAYQTGSGNVLRVIASSPADIDPVLKAIVESARELCEADDAAALLQDGDYLRFSAHSGHIAITIDKWPINRNWTAGRAFVDQKPVHVHDMFSAEGAAFPDARAMGQTTGSAIHTVLSVPLRRGSESIGAILLRRTEVRPFKDKQVDLLSTFADQAVIAIQNARMFNETREALERQTATADILKVIAGSPSDAQPVFEAIATSANRLVGGFSTAVHRVVDDRVELAAFTPTSPAADQALQAAFPMQRSEVAALAMVANGETAQIGDAEAGDPLSRQLGRARGWRSVTFTPLMNRGACIGFIACSRREAGVLADHHVQLLRTFADQAVIAIENARLFSETQEALEQQTATSEVLRVIASSPTDVKPVLEAIVASACKLCEAGDAYLALKDGVDLVVQAQHGTVPVAWKRRPISRQWPAGRAVVDGKFVHLHDVTGPEGEEFPGGREIARRDGTRTVLTVPLVREGESIGTVILRRSVVQPFTDKQIALLKTFADQAVIAIENARLFDETQEALEQQKASADILGVISHSVSETQPVFDEILRSIARLLKSEENYIFLVGKDDLLHVGAGTGPRVEQARALFPSPLEGTVTEAAIRERRLVSTANVFDDPEIPAATRERYRRLGENYAMVVAPMLWEERAIGSIMVARTSMEPFSEKECSLLRTFADQAVIAIQNARLFHETREALERQTATSDILNVIASSPTDTAPVFEAIAIRAKSLVSGFSSTVFRFIEGQACLEAFTPTTPEADEVLKTSFPRPVAAFAPFRMTQSGEVMQIPDVEALTDEIKDIGRARGFRSMLFAPLMHKGTSIGFIAVTRVEPGKFDDHHVQLLRTFADQAVIAIGNTQLFDEVQARTRELAASLDELRAAQDRLVQTEKLASLGQLTAGIAHEIKNPLNFVNNFSSLSAELVGELDEALAPAPLDPTLRGDVGELTAMLKSNLEKVVQHGKRADSIVKNMLLHSREGSGEHRSAELNALVEESLNLAYHGARAEKPTFNVTLTRDLDPDAGSVEVFPQEITRVLLNLISNGFYAVNKRAAEAGPGFEPELVASTRGYGERVEIRIRDNGTGVPPAVKEKMFNPFFTTKPAGEGTGLGLSMSHDIVVKQHGGTIQIETEPGAFTEFIVTLPRATAARKLRSAE
jgi:GAF domain-containing protein